MAITFIAGANGGTSSGTSFSVTLPTTVAGDILILEFTHRGVGDGTIAGTSVTTGGLTWTLKHSQLFATDTFSGKTYWTRATGDHAGQTVTGASLTNSSAAILTQYRGALASGDPLADATIVGEANASGNETQAQITTTTNGAWVVLVVANSPDVAVSTQACTSPGSLAERQEVLSTAGTDTAISHASAEKATAGATGAFTWAQTNGAGGSWAYAITPQVGTTGTGGITLVTPSFPLAFNAVRRSIIDGIVSAQSEGTGWNAQKANIPVTDVVRTSDTVVTITLSALGSYDITSNETLTVTVPRNAIVTGPEIVATPTFDITASAGNSGTGSLAVAASMSGSGMAGAIGTGALAVALALAGTGSQPITGTGAVTVPTHVVAGTGGAGIQGSGDLGVALSMSGTGSMPVSGSGSLVVTVSPAGSGIVGNIGTGALPVAVVLSGSGDAGATTGTGSLALATPTLSGTSPFAAVRAAIIAGLDSAQSEANGWDAIVKAGLPVDAVVRTSDTVVTITLPAFASYSITANETITATIPASALTGGVEIVATPTFDVTADANTGTGSLTVSVGLSGTGIAGNTGTGSLAVAVVPDGDGSQSLINTGDMAVAVAMSGTGALVNSGTGSLAVPAMGFLFGDKVTIPPLVVSGTGSVVNGVSSTSGDLAVAVALSGTGTLVNTGTGSLAIAAILSGSGLVGSGVGTGSIVIPALTLAGTGIQSHSGTGDVAVSVSLSGTGTQTLSGTGSLAATLALDGTGQVIDSVTGTGDMAVACILSGTGAVANPLSGSGDLAVGLAYDDARGLVTARGRRGRYKDDHGAALESVANIGDFKEEHASALIDITDAGV